jgi:SAM-dependent methyltransferase
MNGNPVQYQRQIEAQIAQYTGRNEVHEGAPAAHWMRMRFHADKIRAVFGVESLAEFYATYLARAVHRSGIDHVVSLGSGDSALEIATVKWARDHQLAPFRITCLELSPLLNAKARARVRAEGLERSVHLVEADLNRPLPLTEAVAGFMAHHSLHHLVELEQIFDQVVAWSHPEGAFISADMIGGNGHMRWPETLAVIRRIWPKLPDRLKWDHMFQRLDPWYENWDCSVEGFEGIRAQDILPMLLRKGIRFERFFATGGLTDVFYDRRFGQNFDLENPLDVLFLERVHALEERLLAAGRIKPTCMYAVMRPYRSATCPPQPICLSGATPEMAVRPVDQTMTIGAGEDEAFAVAHPAPPPAPLSVVHPGETLRFARGASGQALLRWGWSDPEEQFTWSVGIESALEFGIAAPVHTIELRFIALKPPPGEHSSLSVCVNGVPYETLDLADGRADRYRLALPTPFSAGSSVVLELSLSRPRRPDLDGGADRRPLGIALISLTLT